MRVRVKYTIDGVMRFLNGELLREDVDFIVIRGAAGDLFTIRKSAIFERIDFKWGCGR